MNLVDNGTAEQKQYVKIVPGLISTFFFPFSESGKKGITLKDLADMTIHPSKFTIGDKDY